MINKNFTVDVKPDIVNGTIANIIGSAKAKVDIGNNDIVFDWTPVDVPAVCSKLTNISMIVNGENGASSGSTTPYQFIFAKSVNGNAPTSLGTIGAAVTAGYDLPSHILGFANIVYKADVLATVTIWPWGVIYNVNEASGSHSAGHDANNEEIEESNYQPGLPIVCGLDHLSSSPKGFGKLYIAGIHKGAREYGTNVLANYASGAPSADTTTTVVVDTTDARKLFQVGDTVHLHDQNAALGTVKSVSQNAIELNANNVQAIANNDELINANPFKIKLGFEV